MQMQSDAATAASPPLFGQFLERWSEEFYFLFRLFFAFFAFLHGIQKAFLLWGFPADHPLGVKVDIAGWVEFIAAILIATGVLTRLAAGALVVQMIWAYFDVHAPNGIWPHIFPAGAGFGGHGGEVPLLWFAIAGIIGVLGARKYSLERKLLGRELL